MHQRCAYYFSVLLLAFLSGFNRFNGPCTTAALCFMHTSPQYLNARAFEVIYTAFLILLGDRKLELEFEKAKGAEYAFPKFSSLPLCALLRALRLNSQSERYRV